MRRDGIEIEKLIKREPEDGPDRFGQLRPCIAADAVVQRQLSLEHAVEQRRRKGLVPRVKAGFGKRRIEDERRIPARLHPEKRRRRNLPDRFHPSSPFLSAKPPLFYTIRKYSILFYFNRAAGSQTAAPA